MLSHGIWNRKVQPFPYDFWEVDWVEVAIITNVISAKSINGVIP